jgi:hypothetical protein
MHGIKQLETPNAFNKWWWCVHVITLTEICPQLEQFFFLGVPDAFDEKGMGTLCN